MAATFAWGHDSGAATGSPAKGTTRTTPTDVNWKNIDDSTSTYSSYPITAGFTSYQKNLFGKFTTGTFNNILSGLFAHTATAFGTGLTLKGVPACTTSGGPYTYVTPSVTAYGSPDAGLTTDMTSAISIASGVAVWFGPTGPEATGKAATQATGADQYTNYLTTQLAVGPTAAAGDTAQVTLTLEYQEN